MEFTTIIILLLAIVVSNLIEKTFPRLPLPLIQIVCGAVLALTPVVDDLSLDPHVFMMLLVAPILFRESEEADIVALWRVKKQVIGFAFLLVFITVFAVGFSVNRLMPSIPLAACFAFGAILGPTDAIAVISLSSRVRIDKKLMATLKGEGLINDASGVISFNFAIAALLTGSFSFFDASLHFVIECAGGFLAGLILVTLKNTVSKSMRKVAAHSTPTFMILELLTPFLCYMLAETIGVSGIIAAVTAGTRQAIRLHRAEHFEAELGTFKKSIWEMLLMAFNAIVFLLLGLQLPGIVENILASQEYSIGFTLLIGLFATGVLLGVRFLAVLFLARGVTGKGVKNTLRDSLILTLSGVKGTVSLATAFSLPLYVGNVPFAERPLLLFITAATIIFSLLLAVIIIPFIAKSPESENAAGNAAQITVLRDVIDALSGDEGSPATAVLINFKRRIQELEHQDFAKNERRELRELRDFAMHIELAAVQAKYHENKMSEEMYQFYLLILSRIYGLSARRMFLKMGIRGNGPIRFFLNIRGHFKKQRKEGIPTVKQKQTATEGRLANAELANAEAEGRLTNTKQAATEEPLAARHYFAEQLQSLFWENTNLIIESLERKRSENSDTVVGHLIAERLELGNNLANGRTEGGEQIHFDGLMEDYDRGLLHAFELERDAIKRCEAEGKITPNEADRMRIDVNLIESYMLEDRHESPLTKILYKAGKKHLEKHGEHNGGAMFSKEFDDTLS